MDLNASGSEIHLSHYWQVIQKRWKVAVAIVLVVMAATFLVSSLAKPLYRSEITIQIERENPNQLTLEDLFGIEASDQEFLQTQYVLLESRGLAQRVIDDLKLLQDKDFYPAGISGKSADEVRAIRDAMAGSLLAGIDVTPVRNTSLVQIAHVAPTPRLAQKVAQGWGAAFRQMNIDRKLSTINDASRFLTTQIADVQRELDQARTQMQRYGQSKDIVSVDSSAEVNPVVQKLVQINADLTTAANDRVQKQAEYESILRMSPDNVAATDNLVQSVSNDISRIQREYNERLAQFKPGHPTMLALSEQLDKARSARASAVQQAFSKAREDARSRLAAASSRESSIRAMYEGQKRETQTLNINATTYQDLQAIVSTQQSLLSTLQKQLSETQVSARLRGSSSSNVHWVDEAQLPRGRFNVTMKRNLQNAFPLGILLGLATIFFLEYMDRSIKTPEELEKVTRFASLGVIPSAESMTRGTYGRTPARLRAVQGPGEEPAGVELIPHTDGRSPVAEAYRAFRTSLLLASARSPKVIVITSSFAREGKTTTSINLATVLAQMGKPVLLVDADLRRPRIQKVFRGRLNLGLVNYLAANIPMQDVIQDTEVPNLSVMLAGPIPPNPSELLASDRMKQMIEQLRAHYAYIIFDSPPVLAVTDAIVLAAVADGVVLTIHGGETPREHVQRSAERLRSSNIPVLGALLNNLDLKQYGAGYRKSYYDYYQSDEREPDTAAGRG